MKEFAQGDETENKNGHRVLLFHWSPWITLPCRNTCAVRPCPTRAGKLLQVQLCVKKTEILIILLFILSPSNIPVEQRSS